MFSQPYELPQQRQVVVLAPAIYEAYVGDYEFAPELVLTVTTEAQRLFAQLTGQKQLEIFPESATEFFLKIVDAQLTFVVDETGKAVRVILHQGGIDQVANRIAR
ncbi:DUF3471 domain-containing protein [Nostoc sp. FACHB-152]|uniref:DUF3471 domain-containing protein n=1 Tax=Nostoc sp. FACHB-152 TaxID=2692837 RepID=UPI001F558062|nr:DUF3471 domain-containing protein [Nostoc sp. FACHB-152]